MASQQFLCRRGWEKPASRVMSLSPIEWKVANELSLMVFERATVILHIELLPLHCSSTKWEISIIKALFSHASLGYWKRVVPRRWWFTATKGLKFPCRGGNGKAIKEIGGSDRLLTYLTGGSECFLFLYVWSLVMKSNMFDFGSCYRRVLILWRSGNTEIASPCKRRVKIMSVLVDIDLVNNIALSWGQPKSWGQYKTIYLMPRYNHFLIKTWT